MGEIESYDLVIVGGGPAGLSAAVNARARNKEVAIFESTELAKKIKWAPEVNNYLGFYDVSGPELAEKFIQHIEKLDVSVISEKVIKAYPMGDKIMLTTNKENYEAGRLLLTIGVSQEDKIEGEAELVGKGVSYCATCDGKLYEGKDTLVISDGSLHEEEANFLAGLCSNVYYLPEYEEVEDLDERIEVIDGEVKEIREGEEGKEVVLTDRTYEVAGVFILRETVPPTEIVPGLELDGNYIKVDSNFETSVEGVYAAGDCIGTPLQISKAAGEGQVAALNAVKEV